MENENDDWDENTVINMDVWLYALLAMTGDKERKADLVRKISEKTGQPPEQIETIITATIKYLTESSRSN